MTNNEFIEQAADRYRYSFFSPMTVPSSSKPPGVGITQIEEHFKAGARAQLSSPLVQRLVEALKAIDPSQPMATKYIRRQALVAFQQETGAAE